MKLKKALAFLLTLTMLLSTLLTAQAKDTCVAPYPTRFDLREYGVVTPVKNQGPWGTCWAFGAIAAAESSILTTLGMTNAEYKARYGKDFDLSEKHLAWYSLHPITAKTEPSQAGEGLYSYNEPNDPHAVYNNGGWNLLVTTLLASGVGPVMESAFPYQGAKGLSDIQIFNEYPEKAEIVYRSAIEGSYEMTLEEMVALANSDPKKGKALLAFLYDSGALDAAVSPSDLTIDIMKDACFKYYKKRLEDDPSRNNYSLADDWTIPTYSEEGHPNRDVTSGFTLVDGNILPDLSIRSKDGKWKSVNEAGVNAVKSELLQGRAVAVAFCADQSLPGQTISQNGFMNTATWAHYTYKETPPNHMVCIVGWDDNYSRNNFNPAHKPPKDGAWIVKNSWGSETDYTYRADGTPNGKTNWGYVDANGNHTGYFYLSYYDKTAVMPESMVFDTDLASQEGDLSVWMYDYMAATYSGTDDVKMMDQSKNVLKTANVFKNDSGKDVQIHAVSTKTASPRARVTYSLYRLNDNYKNPEDGNLMDKKVSYHEYAGFHRLPLKGDLTLKKGETLAVVVEEMVVNENGEEIYEYAVNTAPSPAYAQQLEENQYGVAVVNRGESFYYEDGAWKDWVDELAEADQEFAAHGQKLSDYLAVDNFSIKAYMISK